MMKKLIEELFELQGLDRISIPDLALYGCSDPDKTSYWLVIHGEPKLSTECQAQWLKQCQRATDDPALEKNTNLLIVWKTDTLNTQTSKLLHHVEEDSYFFKKHVLPYTDDEFSGLQQIIDQKGLKPVFHETLSDTQTFSDYKKQYSQGGWQSLLYRLSIKFSSLTIPSSARANLATLENSISERIQSSPNTDVLVATESALLELADSEAFFEETPPDELLKLMALKLEEAGYELDN